VKILKVTLVHAQELIQPVARDALDIYPRRARDRFLSMPTIICDQIGLNVTSPAPSTSSNNQKQEVSFLQLPGELRMLVYKHQLAPFPRQWNMCYSRFADEQMTSGRKGIVQRLPSLGYVNRQVYSEMLSYRLVECQVVIHMEEDIDYFTTILQHLPMSMGFGSVKRVAYQYFSMYASTPARALLFMDFLRQLPNLEEVVISMRLDHIHGPAGATSGIKSAEQIATKYSLAKLCRLPSNASIVLRCEWNNGDNPTARAVSAFFDVQDWLVQAFADDGGGRASVVKGEHLHNPRWLALWTLKITR
jgi:hypothetical protein